MDSNSEQISQPNTPTTQSEKKKRKGLCYHIVLLVISCIFFTFLFSLLAFFFIFTAGFVSILIDNFSIPTTNTTTSSLSAQCKIVSTGVDLRSSKVCELGLLNYKAKYVFDPLVKTRFRCRYDYCWATIFKIEYWEHSSGEIISALVEAPKEALPLDCRPSFGTAWLTKDKFKVNETYNCKYTPGISDVDMFPDNLFNCQAKDPSTFDMIRRYSALSMKIVGFWFSSKGSTKRAIRESAVSGIVTGMATSLIVLTLVRVLQRSKSRYFHGLDVLTELKVLLEFSARCKADTGGSTSLAARGFKTAQADQTLIGKGGETIKSIQTMFRANIEDLEVDKGAGCSKKSPASTPLVDIELKGGAAEVEENPEASFFQYLMEEFKTDAEWFRSLPAEFQDQLRETKKQIRSFADALIKKDKLIVAPYLPPKGVEALANLPHQVD